MRYLPFPPATIILLMVALLMLPQIDARADDGARAFLANMLEAAESLSYEGTFVYIQGQHVEAMAIAHQAGEQGSSVENWQHLSALNGTPREIIITDDQIICLLPEKQIACQGVSQRRSPFPISLPKNLDKLGEFYRFQILGQDRTAGYATRVVAIQPIDDYRFGYQFWLHDETSMVLRSALLDKKGQVLEQLMFTDFSIHPRGELPAQPPPRGLQPANSDGVAEKPVAVEESAWSLGELPPGFEPILHNRYGEGAQSTEHMVLSDGLATVSVFLEPLAPGAEVVLDGFSRMGAMNAFGLTHAAHQIMVVGEAPELTVRAIAGALSYAD